MKKLLLSFFLVPSVLFVSCLGTNTISRGVSIDKIENDGSRSIVSDINNLYAEWTSAAAFRLSCLITSTHDTTFILMVTLNEGKLTIDKGRKMLIKFEDNTIMELSNISKIGPTDYDYNVTRYGTDYYVYPDYKLTVNQINELMTKKAVKVRIEHDLGEIDRELSGQNKLGKGITAEYESIIEALNTKKNIYSNF